MLEFSSKKLRVLRFFLIVLILASSLYLIREIIDFTFSKKGTTASVSKKSKNERAKKISLMYYAPILEKNPFGEPIKLYSIAPAREERKAVGRVSDLILMGTVTGPDRLSYAIFEDRAGSQNMQEAFALGKEVFGHGRLIKIRSTSADIKGASGKFTVSIIDADYGKPALKQSKGGKSANSSFIKKLGDTEYLLDRESVLSSLESPEHILTDARMLPNIKNGKQEGFVILEVAPGGIYDSLGLQNNDILLRVNGLAMSNPEVAIQAMTALKGMNKINLDIIRANKKMSFSYKIR